MRCNPVMSGLLAQHDFGHDVQLCVQRSPQPGGPSSVNRMGLVYLRPSSGLRKNDAIRESEEMIHAVRGRPLALPMSVAVVLLNDLTGRLDCRPCSAMPIFFPGSDRKHLGEPVSGAIDPALHSADGTAANTCRFFIG